MSQEKNRKRVNIFVDVEKFDRFKRLLETMGITITEFFDGAMTDFINQMETIIENQDKEAFLKMMAKNLDEIQKQVEEELKK
ncbi:MAG: hypothetical protein ACI4XM_07730 [Candidatus Coprovivens sp.]